MRSVSASCGFATSPTRARVEIAPDELGRVQSEGLAPRIEADLLALGFPAVEIDPRGYRSGRLNEGVVGVGVAASVPLPRGAEPNDGLTVISA